MGLPRLNPASLNRALPISIFLLALLSWRGTTGEYAQIFSFGQTAPTGGPNLIGEPQGRLTQCSDGKLYGGTSLGGYDPSIGGGIGVIFSINTDGAGFTVVHPFSGHEHGSPYGGVIQGTDGVLYGTTGEAPFDIGGGFGSIFKMNTDGSGYTVLHVFSNTGGDGVSSMASLLQASNGVLYGTTQSGGASGNGTVFKINTDGTGYSILHSFGGGIDGAYPVAALIQGKDGSLYGTTSFYGVATGFGYGTVFKMNLDGTGYSILTGSSGSAGALLQGSDGALYATGSETVGGSFSHGMIFKINTDGTGYSVIFLFPVSNGGSDMTLLQASDGALYGTEAAGPYGSGLLFKINTDGSGYAIVHCCTSRMSCTVN